MVLAEALRRTRATSRATGRVRSTCLWGVRRMNGGEVLALISESRRTHRHQKIVVRVTCYAFQRPRGVRRPLLLPHRHTCFPNGAHPACSIPCAPSSLHAPPPYASQQGEPHSGTEDAARPRPLSSHPSPCVAPLTRSPPPNDKPCMQWAQPQPSSLNLRSSAPSSPT